MKVPWRFICFLDFSLFLCSPEYPSPLFFMFLAFCDFQIDFSKLLCSSICWFFYHSYLAIYFISNLFASFVRFTVSIFFYYQSTEMIFFSKSRLLSFVWDFLSSFCLICFISSPQPPQPACWVRGKHPVWQGCRKSLSHLVGIWNESTWTLVLFGTSVWWNCGFFFVVCGFQKCLLLYDVITRSWMWILLFLRNVSFVLLGLVRFYEYKWKWPWFIYIFVNSGQILLTRYWIASLFVVKKCNRYNIERCIVY